MQYGVTKGLTTILSLVHAMGNVAAGAAVGPYVGTVMDGPFPQQRTTMTSFVRLPHCWPKQDIISIEN